MYEELKIWLVLLYSHVISFHHIVSGPIYFLYCDFPHLLLSDSWFCTLSRGQIDGSWFDPQRLWVLLMVPIVSHFFSDLHELRIGIIVICQLSDILLRISCACITVWCQCSLPISAISLKPSYVKVWCKSSLWFCLFSNKNTSAQIFSYSFIECNVEHWIQIH